MNLSYQTQRHLFLISVVYVLSVSVAMADLTTSSRVNLEQHLYFKSLNGDPVQVHPGQYMVELKDIWLQLTPVEGERFDAILVETQRNSHEQDISRAEAILVPSTEEVIDIQQLVLYLPMVRLMNPRPLKPVFGLGELEGNYETNFSEKHPWLADG